MSESKKLTKADTDSEVVHVFLEDEAATIQLGQYIANALEEDCVIALRGPLGAGKTTLVRGFMRGLGYERRVRSPTYTLVEPYTLDDRSIVHLDLYRLSDPDEFEFLGVTDLERATTLIEWPDHAPRLADRADCSVALAYDDAGRLAVISSRSSRGHALLQRLSSLIPIA